MAFLLGAAAGAALTWLLSSEEGKKTRDKLKKSTTDLIDDLMQGKSPRTKSDSKKA